MNRKGKVVDKANEEIKVKVVNLSSDGDDDLVAARQVTAPIVWTPSSSSHSSLPPPYRYPNLQTPFYFFPSPPGATWPELPLLPTISILQIPRHADTFLQLQGAQTPSSSSKAHGHLPPAPRRADTFLQLQGARTLSCRSPRAQTSSSSSPSS